MGRRGQRRFESLAPRPAAVNRTELARDLNIILRTAKYPDREAWEAGVRRCSMVVGRENQAVLLGKKEE